MKKVLSISFAFLILLSVVHLTIATHICGGEIAQVKVSLSGSMGTCGMEDESDRNTPPLGYSHHCCDDESIVFAVDKNYSPVNFQFTNLLEHQSIAPFILFSESYSLSDIVNSVPANVKPPGNTLVSAVILPFICVFRI